MDLDERFELALQSLELMRAELLDAREAARDDPASWGGWSVRFNQRLRSERSATATLLAPPEGSDPRLFPLYDSAVALRDLWEALNRVIQGGDADVALRRVALETALHRAREAILAE